MPHPTDLTALGFTGRWPALLDLVRDDLDPATAATAVAGRIIRADRGAATARTADDSHRIIWTPATEPPVTGDWVLLDPTAGVLLGIAPRATALTRPRTTKRPDASGQQVLAANMDLVGVLAGVEDDLNVRRLERALVMAYESGATPLVILTKIDLIDDRTIPLAQARATAVGVDVLPVSPVTGEGMADLADRLAPDRTIALLGASGAGKSTLTNALVGSEVLQTGAVRAVDGRGRHTTTHRELVTLPTGGAVLDTPGLRSLSLGVVEEGMDQAFPEISELAGACRFNDCRHDEEPGCAVTAALDDGRLDGDRFEGWRRIRAASESAALRADIAAYRAEARSWGRVYREAQALRRDREGR
ncbi:ribosome small subunit-dependent GTPase A [Euzebya tangerina]|uniref:ribosome small subunit-dependent GTPase A n=1 Tax=Euzebya tangerina TaxID=591198 RepID=UPI000E312990|nr:ribosome small subunit-dependent GTPase A [Euzebya tangerina]